MPPLFRTATTILILTLGLTACGKPVVAPANQNQATNPTAQSPTEALSAESFSTKGITLVEGKDYEVLTKPQPVQTKGKAEVLEFFWYGCSHCYAIEPAVKAWQKTLSANVQFTRYHAQWGEPMKAHQRIAMTLQALGKANELDGIVFKAIQEQGRALTDPDKISEFMSQNGLDKAAWDAAYKGFDVNASILKADTLFTAYGLDGVPSFIVNGQYLVKGDSVRTLQVINKLLEQK